MIKRIKQLINEFRTREQVIETKSREIEGLSRELVWANIFHDTIKGRDWLKDLQLSPGRSASNYSLLYILTRILSDYQPKTILEFGLGETSKLISTFLKNELETSKHIIVEHNDEWVNLFKKRFSLPANSSITLHESIVTTIHEFDTNSYEKLEVYSEQIMDLYLVDGISTSRFSRNYIINMLEKVSKSDEFIIIIDDYERQGEQDTANELIKFLNQKNIKIFSGVYTGNKSQIVIATEKYFYSTSL